jgi:hypothetical protein
VKPKLRSEVVAGKKLAANFNSSFPSMSKYTAFRCPEDLLELAKVKAKKDRRSLSNYIITLIERDVKDESELETTESKLARK